MTADSDTALPAVSDVVIIGGGIVGSFTALELARRDRQPVVLEKGQIGGEQSSRNWGYIRQAAREDPEIPLMMEANRVWSNLENEVGVSIDWAQRGNLRLLAADSDLEWYQNWTAKGNKLGIPTRMLAPDEIADVLPGVHGTWAGAMYTPNDGQADPARASTAVAGAARAAGARVLPGVTAQAILVRAGRVVGVATPHATIATETVVVCGGVWSRRLLRPLGLDLPLQWVRSTVAETAPVPGLPDIPAVWSPRVSFRKTGNGTVVFAASGRAELDLTISAFNNASYFLPTLMHNLPMFHPRLNRAVLLDLRNHISAKNRYTGWEPNPDRASVRRSHTALGVVYPELKASAISRSWAGYIDGTPDNLPVLSLVSGIEGLVVGAGFSGHGFGLSPASGQVLADLVATSECSRYDVSAFRYDRFGSGKFRRAKRVAQ